MSKYQSSKAIGFSAVNLEVATIGIFVLLVFAALHEAKYFLAPFLSAIVIGLLVGRVETRLERYGMPPNFAAALLTFASLAGLLLISIGLIGPLEYWFERMPIVWFELRMLLASLEEPLRNLAEVRDDIRNVLGGGANLVVAEKDDQMDGVVFAVPALAGQILIFVGTFYFFLADRRELKCWLLGTYPQMRDRMRIGRMIAATEYAVSHYLALVALVNLGFGVLVACLMAAIGLPEPLLWGALAFALNFVPYLGPAIMTILIFCASMINFYGLTLPFVAAGGFVLLNLVEGQFVTPSIIGRSVTTSPFLVFASLAFGLWFWGAIGAFLAVPILLVCRNVSQHSLHRSKTRETVPAFA